MKYSKSKHKRKGLCCWNHLSHDESSNIRRWMSDHFITISSLLWNISLHCPGWLFLGWSLTNSLGLLQPHPWPLIGQFWLILGSDWLKFPLLLPICEMTGLGLMINLTTIITVTHNKFASGQTENRKKGRNRKRIINSWRVLLLS